jgi:hypothetical protein
MRDAQIFLSSQYVPHRELGCDFRIHSKYRLLRGDSKIIVPCVHEIYKLNV